MSDLLGPAYVAARWGFYLAVFLMIGASSFAPFFFPRTNPFRSNFPDTARALHRRAAALGIIGSVAAIAFAVLRLWMQTRTLRDVDEPLTLDFLRAVFTTSWGHGWTRQVLAAAIGGLGFTIARKRGAGWLIAILATLGLIVSAGMTGHAATTEAGPGGWLLDAAHVGAGGVWLGGLAILMTAGLASCRALDGPDRQKAHRLLVGAFSRRALVVAPVTMGFGMWLGIRYLGWTWPFEFYHSGYGWALAVKLGIVLVVGGLGAYNWRVVQPGLEDHGGDVRFRRSGVIELVFGILVLGVTAVLVALPFSEHGR